MEGVRDLHENKSFTVLHNDLKPDNILFNNYHKGVDVKL